MHVIYFYFYHLIHALQTKEKQTFKGYSQVSAKQFVDELALKFDSKIYFDIKDIDSLNISLKEGIYSLFEVLQLTIQSNGLQFAIDGFGNVFISKKFQIQTELANHYFDKKIDSLGADNTILPPVLNKSEKGQLNVSIEQKLFEVGNKTNMNDKSETVLAGYVRDYKNGEAISGAIVFVGNSNVKIITDQFGYYTLRLPRGRHTLYVSSMRHERYQT